MVNSLFSRIQILTSRYLLVTGYHCNQYCGCTGTGGHLVRIPENWRTYVALQHWSPSCIPVECYLYGQKLPMCCRTIEERGCICPTGGKSWAVPSGSNTAFGCTCAPHSLRVLCNDPKNFLWWGSRFQRKPGPMYSMQLLIGVNCCTWYALSNPNFSYSPISLLNICVL